MAKTINELILDFFTDRPGEEFGPSDVVDWVTPRYSEEHGEPPRDVPRSVRKLAQKRKLIRVRYGVYKYNSNQATEIELQDFPPAVKKAIHEKDNYQCVVCGLGERDNVDIAADHIIPLDNNGTNDIENGQTLCTQHNNMKKNYSRTEAGKKYFIKIYEIAVNGNDERMIAFCESVFDAYDEHGVNGHIERPDTNTKQT